MKNRYSIIHFIYFSSLEIRNKNLKRSWVRNLFVMELCVGEKQSVPIMSRQIERGVDCWLCGRPVRKPTRGTGSGGVRAEDREVREERRRVAEPAVTLSLAFKNSLSGLSQKPQPLFPLSAGLLRKYVILFFEKGKLCWKLNFTCFVTAREEKSKPVLLKFEAVSLNS